MGKVADNNMLGAETLINYCLGKTDDIHPEQTQKMPECILTNFEDNKASSFDNLYKKETLEQ